MSQIWHSIMGPRLFRIYNLYHGTNESGSSVYTPNYFENFGNRMIQGINLVWNIGVYTSPLVITYLYKRNYFCMMGCYSLGKFATGIGILIMIGMVIRGIGRYSNKPYIDFLNNWTTAKNNYTNVTKKTLSGYDFEFWAHPFDFNMKEVGENVRKSNVDLSSQGKLGFFSKIISFPCYVTSYFCIQLFGRHLIYPGSIHLLQFIMDNMLQIGREKLVVEYKGERNKLLTKDSNEIDTMFIDRRKSARHPFGSTLVVCCEGNAGFYEVGTMAIPIEAGYSVLGWNHPGFAGSSGKPFPDQDQNAIDAVMQFAIQKLNFQPEEIMIYAWSIGGYTGTWAAMNYPEIKGVVLDATFDDILPLALPKMPSFMGGIIKRAIRDFMNLNNIEQLCHYPGPVSIIRRTRDEIITTVEGDISTNRGNNLLIKLLKYRYPKLLSENSTSEILSQWVSEDSHTQEMIYKSFQIEEDYYLTQLTSYIEMFGEKYPMNIGEDWTSEQKIKMIIFLAQKMFINSSSTHNMPLDSVLFKMPWTPYNNHMDSSYVKL